MKQRGALALALLLLGVALAWPLPEAWFAAQEHPRLLDRRGVVLAERRHPERGQQDWVALDQVSPWLVPALLQAEDRRYYAHPGVDPLAIARAARANLGAGRVVQGGSTLTQQTARLLGGRRPGLLGKLGEAWTALRLDLHLSKEEILTWYLNRVSFGAGTVGVEAAARTYFNSSAASLSAAEVATLVALLPAPEARNPWRDAGATVLPHRNALLRRLGEAGVLLPDEVEVALTEPLQLARPPAPELAFHLAEKLLLGRSGDQQTTLDATVQALVEREVRAQLEGLPGVDHAAVLVVDWPTREVLAYVGSGDPRAPDGQVDGVQARRSPGSTLKPFLYAYAFEGDLRPGDLLPDLPARFANRHGSWVPANYSGRFYGPVRARDALGGSLNLPAVEVLARIGVPTALARLREAGLRSLEQPAAHYGLGLALGDGEVSLWELTRAYAALADSGHLADLRLTPDPTPLHRRPILDPQVAQIVADILADPAARLDGFGRDSPLERRYPASVKTGTSTGFRDNWTLGWAGTKLVGVWVGNFDARPMNEVGGVTGAAPLWGRVLDALTPAPPPTPVLDLPRDHLCALSGALAGPHCPHTRPELRLPRSPPPETCSWHLPDCALAWPATYSRWATEQGRLAEPGCAPTPGGQIHSPHPGAVYFVDPRDPPEAQQIPLGVDAPAGAKEVVWQVDGRMVARVGPPFQARFQPSYAGDYRVQAIVDGAATPEVSFTVGGLPARPAGG